MSELKPVTGSSVYQENANDADDSPTITFSPTMSGTDEDTPSYVQTFDDRGIIYQLPRKVIMGRETDGSYSGEQTILRDTTDVLFILNERLVVKKVLTKSSSNPPTYTYSSKCHQHCTFENCLV